MSLEENKLDFDKIVTNLEHLFEQDRDLDNMMYIYEEAECAVREYRNWLEPEIDELMNKVEALEAEVESLQGCLNGG